MYFFLGNILLFIGVFIYYFQHVFKKFSSYKLLVVAIRTVLLLFLKFLYIKHKKLFFVNCKFCQDFIQFKSIIFNCIMNQKDFLRILLSVRKLFFVFTMDSWQNVEDKILRIFAGSLQIFTQPFIFFKPSTIHINPVFFLWSVWICDTSNTLHYNFII